jgi:two-component system sensor histidine kinase VicK
MKRLKILDRIHWKFITIYILLILIAMQVIGAYFIKALESHYVNNFTRMLDQQASLFSYSIQNYLEEPVEPTEEEELEQYKDINFLIDRIFSAPNVDIQVLDKNGIVVGTNTDKQAIIGQRNTQIEVKRALLGTRDETIRINPKNGHRMKILSLPIKVGEEVVGAIYLMASMEEMYQTIRDINNILATGTFIALALTAGLGIALAKTITSPIKEMTTQATAMADGDFSRQVKIYGKDEIGQLANAFNHLSDRLSKALSENAEEKNKLASILFYMSDGVVATDRRGRIILMNHTAETMLNRKEYEGVGLKLSEVLNVPQEVKNETLLLEDSRFLIEMKTEEHTHILQVNVTPLKREGRSIQGVIAVLQDVTNQEKLERERKEFVANVSHELRTPLTTMKSYLEALEDGVLTDPELGPRFIQVTQNETERMIRLVNDLLQLSKMDTKKYPLKLQKTDLNHLIEDVAERFSVSLRQRGLHLQLELFERLPLIYVDSDQMIQVLDNVISNAIKHSLADGTIHIRTQRQNEEVLISIKDEGVGIPQADLKHIFKRFYRVDKARSRDMGGTGLGLSIAREMILGHQGTIRINSDTGEGTTVWIQLPMHKTKGGNR